MVMKFGMSPGGQWFLRHISPRVDPSLMRLTRGRVSSMGTFPRFVLLTCTGAKSRVRRTTPLIYFTDGDRVVLIASNYGGTRHPAWYYNVKANPVVTLLGGGFEGRFACEEVTGAERERLWALAKQWNPATRNTNHPPAVAESPFSHLHLPVSRRSATSNVVRLDERVIRKVALTPS
jgi:deazaflavin-dependent oxidoreductase (nitroreductase family)